MAYNIAHTADNYNVALSTTQRDYLTPAFTDAFDYTNGQNLSAQTGWVQVWDELVCTGSAVTGGANDTDHVAYYNASLPDIQYAKATVQSDGFTSYAGVGVRLNSDGTGYAALLTLNFILNLRRYDADGGHNTLLSGGITYTSDPVDIMITADGSTITAYANGTQILQTIDANYSSGYAGVAARLTSQGETIDNFECGVFGPLRHNITQTIDRYLITT